MAKRKPTNPRPRAAKKKTTAKKKPSAKKKTAKKKPARPGTVDRWVSRLPPPARRIVEGLRKLIRETAPELDEAIKWSQPVYSGRQPICYIMARSTGHVTFGFWNGRALEDPARLLQGSGSRMRHLKIERLGDIPAAQLRHFVQQAVAIDGRTATDPPT